MPGLPLGTILNGLGGGLGFITQRGQNRRANAANRAAQQEARNTNQFGSEDLQTQIKDAGADIGNRINQASTQQLYGDNPSAGQQFQGYMGRANAAQDYQQQTGDALVSGFQQRLNAVLGDLQGMGTSAQRNIDRSATQLQGQTMDDLVSRGLTGTTILPSARLGVEAQRQRATDSLQEQLRTERANTIAGLSGDTLNAFAQSRGQGLQTMLGTTGDFLGAQDTANTRSIGNLANTYGAAQGVEGNRITNDVGLTVNPNFLPQGPGAPNAGDFLTSFGNTLTANRYAAYDPPSNTGQVLAGSLGSAALTGGTTLGAAGILGSALRIPSSKEYKTDNADVEDDDMLDAVRKMDVQTWRYKGDNKRHIGPMAEDFAEETGHGDGKSISIQDAIGTLMSSVKALDKRVAHMSRKRR